MEINIQQYILLQIRALSILFKAQKIIYMCMHIYKLIGKYIKR